MACDLWLITAVALYLKTCVARAFTPVFAGSGPVGRDAGLQVNDEHLGQHVPPSPRAGAAAPGRHARIPNAVAVARLCRFTANDARV